MSVKPTEQKEEHDEESDDEQDDDKGSEDDVSGELSPVFMWAKKRKL